MIRRGDDFFAPSREGVSRMVTYEGLFTFCLVLLGVAELIFGFTTKRNNRPVLRKRAVIS